jgi:CubicO group peptidase (beta-lactamase class C family)
LGDHFKFGQPIPTLAEYYGGALHLVAEPGTRFTYSDHSIATAGQIVEDVSGEPLDRYFRERIFEPLGMADSDFVRSEKVKSHLATGYDLGSRGTKAVPDVVHVTSAASAIYSTPRDMARYVAALLGGGGNEHGSVLKPATVRTMFEPHYQTDPRLPGMGLGFWRFDLGGHLAVEHEGLLPGFNSQIFLAPEDGIGVIAFTNGARGALMWLPAEVGNMLRRLLDVPDDAIRTDVPHHPEIWAELCGRYPLSARLTDTQARALVGLGAEVFVRRGALMIRSVNPIPVLYRGFALHPDDDKDPYAFRIDLSRFGIGTTRVVFSRGPGPGATRVHLELVPLSLERQRPRTGALLG